MDVCVFDQCSYFKIFVSLKTVHSPLLYVNSLRLSSVSSTEFCVGSINMNHIVHLKKK